MSLWSTLPPDEQVLTEPAETAVPIPVEDHDERAGLRAYRQARRRSRR